MNRYLFFSVYNWNNQKIMNFLIEKIFLEIKPPTRHGDMGMLLLILKSSDPILASQEVVRRHISLSNTFWKDHYFKTQHFITENKVWNLILVGDMENIFSQVCNFFLKCASHPKYEVHVHDSTSKSTNGVFLIASATQFTFYCFLYLMSIQLIVFKSGHDLFMPCEF